MGKYDEHGIGEALELELDDGRIELGWKVTPELAAKIGETLGLAKELRTAEECRTKGHDVFIDLDDSKRPRVNLVQLLPC